MLEPCLVVPWLGLGLELVPWLVVPWSGLVLADLVPGLAGLGLVLVPGRAPAAARVAKARAKTTLNCIMLFFVAIIPNTE